MYVIRNHRGNAILFVLGLLVLFGAIMHFSLSRISQNANDIKNTRTLNVRDGIVAHIARYSTIGASFRSSLLPGEALNANLYLSRCVLGEVSASCAAQDAIYPIALYHPLKTGGNTALKLVAGPGPADSPQARPALYDTKGNPCPLDITEATLTCPFEAFAAFVPTCAGGASSCVNAQSISIQFTVRVSPKLDESTKNALGRTSNLAPVSRTTASISREEILPPDPDKASGNVVVSILTVVEEETQNQPASKPTADPALVALIKLSGVKSDRTATDLALSFQANNITDQTLISEIVKSGIKHWGDENASRIITAIAAAGITDIKTAKIIAEAGITKASWAQVVAKSGITDTYLAGELQNSKITNPAKLAAIVAAVAGVGVRPIALSIAERGIDDATVVGNMWSSLSSIKNTDIAVAIVKSRTTDPTLITQIANAVSEIKNSEVAEALAEAKITDKSTALTLEKIVSVISDEEDAGELAAKGVSDPTITERLVAEYLINASAKVAKNSGSSNTKQGSSGSTTTTKTTKTTQTTQTNTGTGTTKTAPPPVTLLSTCTSGCSTPAF